MKRAQRRIHLLVWLLLIPIVAGVFIVALKSRYEVPVETYLPDGE